MSQYSGKCDLADDFFMGMPKDLSDRWEGGDWNALQEYFEIYKKQIGGIIYRSHHIKEVTEYNQNLIAEINPAFKFEKHEEIVKDKRYRDGEKTRTYYTYEYWGIEFSSLKELNKTIKDGVWLSMPQHIETIYDLIEFFPYVISLSAWDGERDCKYIRVGTFSYVEREYQEFLEYGHNSQDSYEYYKRKLRDFTRKCIEAGL